MSISQGTWVFFGERGQENVGKVDEKSTDGLLGRVKKPGKDKTESAKFDICVIFFLFCCITIVQESLTTIKKNRRSKLQTYERFYL